MKKNICFALFLLAFCISSCYNDDIEDINNRLNAIENTKIASINEQISSIENSIQLLTNVDNELNSYIDNLEKSIEEGNERVDSIITVIDELKIVDKAIEDRITTLQSYIDGELSANKAWAEATFATLDQFNALAKEITTLKSYVDNTYNSLSNSITDLETSMQSWVNEKLTGYYTIAEIDAKLAVMKKENTDVDNEIKEDVNALQRDLTTAKSELTTGYQNAIAEAINSNNGVINAKIAKEIETVNDKIANLEKRLNDIESRLTAVEDAIEQMKALNITFNITEDKAVMAGASVFIEYTISGGDAETVVEAWGDGGWSAMVVSENVTKGKIKVTAPKGATNGKVVVLATSGAGGVKMKTLYFTEGILTNINDTYEVEWEANALAVVLQTNLNYTVNIPEPAQSWISLLQTRATVRTETITFNISENPEEQQRIATIELIGECGDILQTFDIIQKAQPSDGYIEFADRYAKAVCVENFDLNNDGEISYKEATKVTIINKYFFGDYANAIISFDELQHFINVVEIKKNAFSGCTNLKSLTLPDNVTIIDDRTFSGCTNLEGIIIPDGVTSIGEYAFSNCESLESIVFPNSVTNIKSDAFYQCYGIKSVHIPNSVTDIGVTAFRYCNSLESITIPSGRIGMLAFAQCENLKEATFGDNVTFIGKSAFGSCMNLTTVTIGTGIETIDEDAFASNKNITAVYCKAINPPTLGDEAFHYDFYTPSAKCTFYVPTESVWLYKSTKWKVYADYIVGYDFE